jgi:hypothetical protein
VEKTSNKLKPGGLRLNTFRRIWKLVPKQKKTESDHIVLHDDCWDDV